MSSNNKPGDSGGLIAIVVVFVLICLSLPKPWGAILLAVGVLGAGGFFYAISGYQGDTAKDYVKRIVKAIIVCIILFLLCGGWGLFFIGK